MNGKTEKQTYRWTKLNLQAMAPKQKNLETKKGKLKKENSTNERNLLEISYWNLTFLTLVDKQFRFKTIFDKT